MPGLTAGRLTRRGDRGHSPRLPRALTVATVAALRTLANRFGSSDRARKQRALAACERAVPADADTLIAYHDCLLFLLAYPEDATLHSRALRELVRMAAAARGLCEQGDVRTRRKLDGSGIAWTTSTFAFGYEITRWLTARHPLQAELDSFADDGANLPTTLRQTMPGIEFELLANENLPALDWLDEAAASRRGTRLAWLVGAFERIPASDGVREQLFDALRPFITLSLGNSTLSRTFVRGPPGRRFYHRGPPVRSVDPLDILDTPLKPVPPLPLGERICLIDTARAMLASMGRETDAIASAWPQGVEYHQLARGTAIALFTIRPERRPPLDSHVGFMLFKNGIPIGYGGGWPFLSTSRIGVNIFAPFRGGESAWLFCQVLRVYRQRFGIARFVAEPSQFGAGNAEGLASGAFWFYYRLGFRPMQPRLAAFAAEEFARMSATSSYRTPLSGLRRLTHSDIAFDVGGEDVPRFDAADLSLAVSAWITRRHHGDRPAALRAATVNAQTALAVTDLARLNDHERSAFEQWSLLLAQIPDLAGWPASERRALLTMLRAKGGSEFLFHDRMRRLPRLHRALARIVARAAAS